MDTKLKRRDENIRRIVTAAMKCFAEGSPTMKIISKACGTPTGTVHYYFNTKEDLFNHCLELALSAPTVRNHAKVIARWHLDADRIREAARALERS